MLLCILDFELVFPAVRVWYSSIQYLSTVRWLEAGSQCVSKVGRGTRSTPHPFALHASTPAHLFTCCSKPRITDKQVKDKGPLTSGPWDCFKTPMLRVGGGGFRKFRLRQKYTSPEPAQLNLDSLRPMVVSAKNRFIQTLALELHVPLNQPINQPNFGKSLSITLHLRFLEPCISR